MCTFARALARTVTPTGTRTVRGTVARLSAACLALATSLFAGEATARDATCRAAPASSVDRLRTRDATLTAAQALVTPLDRPRGRALFLALLAHDPEDDDAAVGLARLDAWDGCLSLAERGYRGVLARTDSHVEARAGLLDVLIWMHRWDDAAREADRGVALMPIAPELLSRRARIAFQRGDARAAVQDLTEAERVSPSDPELRAARSRVFLGQARLGQRLQLFPSGYDDVATTDASVMQRWRRARLELGVTVVSRRGAERPIRTGLRRTNVVDGRPTAGAYAHLQNGGWVGASVGFGAPALSVPRYAFEASGMTPLSERFWAHLTAAYWMYRDDREVVVASPALGVALTESVDMTARYWSTAVIVHDGGGASVEVVHSAGARFAWRLDERTTLGLDYAYGVQLERLPGASELLDLTSHVVTASARVMVSRSFGVDGAASLERRESSRTGAVVFGPALEAGVLARW